MKSLTKMRIGVRSEYMRAHFRSAVAEQGFAWPLGSNVGEPGWPNAGIDGSSLAEANEKLNPERLASSTLKTTVPTSFMHARLEMALASRGERGVSNARLFIADDAALLKRACEVRIHARPYPCVLLTGAAVLVVCWLQLISHEHRSVYVLYSIMYICGARYRCASVRA